MYMSSIGGHVPLSGTPSPLPLVPTGLPGGKGARKEFLLSLRRLRFAKIHPRTAHVAAADMTWRGCGPSIPPGVFGFPDKLFRPTVCDD